MKLYRMRRRMRPVVNFVARDHCPKAQPPAQSTRGLDGRQSGEGADSYLVTFWGGYFCEQTVPCTHVDATTTPHAAEGQVAPISHLKNAWTCAAQSRQMMGARNSNSWSATTMWMG